MVEVYVGLGGNLAGTLETMRQAVSHLRKEYPTLILSRLYRTSPVSPIPQPSYLNAVCKFETSLPLRALCRALSSLESSLGKEEKSKESPRLIDLDLLFYGSWVGELDGWIVPHPRWHERLFVLAPLADITDCVPVGAGLTLHEMLKRFTNPHEEKVDLHEEGLYVTKSF